MAIPPTSYLHFDLLFLIISKDEMSCTLYFLSSLMLFELMTPQRKNQKAYKTMLNFTICTLQSRETTSYWFMADKIYTNICDLS